MRFRSFQNFVEREFLSAFLYILLYLAGEAYVRCIPLKFNAHGDVCKLNTINNQHRNQDKLFFSTFHLLWWLFFIHIHLNGIKIREVKLLFYWNIRTGIWCKRRKEEFSFPSQMQNYYFFQEEFLLQSLTFFSDKYSLFMRQKSTYHNNSSFSSNHEHVKQ